MATLRFVDDPVIASLYPEKTPTQRDQLNDDITSLIHEYCNTTFEEVTYTNEVQDSKTALVPDHLPINSVTTLIDGEYTEWVENTDYYVYSDRVDIVSPTLGKKAISITYKAGFTTVPQMVKLIAEELVRFKAFKETEGSALFYKEQTFEERTYKWDKNTSELSILAKIKRYVQKGSSRTAKASIRVGVM
jgi:Tfp pilus assembly protein PilX